LRKVARSSWILVGTGQGRGRRRRSLSSCPRRARNEAGRATVWSKQVKRAVFSILRIAMAQRLSVVCAVCLAVIAVSCASAAKHLFPAPPVAFGDVALEGISPIGGRLRVSLLVRNPNGYSLSTSGLSYRLYVKDSIPVAAGEDTEHHTVPGHDSTVLALPLNVSWAGLSAAANAVASYGLVPYRVTGDVI